MFRRTLIFAAGAMVLTGCASGPTVRVDSDPAANVAAYRSYSWVFSRTPAGMNPLLYQRVKDAIDRELAAKGYARAEPGDFAVAFTLGARDRVDVTDYGSYGAAYPGWGQRYGARWVPVYSSVDVRNVTEGSLAIDIYDTAVKQPVWHGVASQDLPPAGADAELVNAAVAAVLAKFPSR